MTAEIGQDLGFRRCGLTYATTNPKQLAEWDSWRPVARQFGVATRMMTAEEVTAAVPTAGGRPWIGGVHAADDGKADPLPPVAIHRQVEDRSWRLLRWHRISITRPTACNPVTSRSA